jgi:hypothetical protein
MAVLGLGDRLSGFILFRTRYLALLGNAHQEALASISPGSQSFRERISTQSIGTRWNEMVMILCLCLLLSPCVAHSSGDAVDCEQCATQEFAFAVARSHHAGGCQVALAFAEAFEQGDLEKT